MFFAKNNFFINNVQGNNEILKNAVKMDHFGILLHFEDFQWRNQASENDRPTVCGLHENHHDFLDFA